MEPDDEAPLTLSKWPFYLGDALLVVTALAIAILGNWQLTDMQVIACVIAVALGAVIFGLPLCGRVFDASARRARRPVIGASLA